MTKLPDPKIPIIHGMPKIGSNTTAPLVAVRTSLMRKDLLLVGEGFNRLFCEFDCGEDLEWTILQKK